jgi:hypothetical protein
MPKVQHTRSTCTCLQGMLKQACTKYLTSAHSCTNAPDGKDPPNQLPALAS